MSFSQLPAVKKDTKNSAPGIFLGHSYFVTALEDYQITAWQLSDNDMVASDNAISYKSRWETDDNNK